MDKPSRRPLTRSDFATIMLLFGFHDVDEFMDFVARQGTREQWRGAPEYVQRCAAEVTLHSKVDSVAAERGEAVQPVRQRPISHVW